MIAILVEADLEDHLAPVPRGPRRELYLGPGGGGAAVPPGPGRLVGLDRYYALASGHPRARSS